MVIASALPKEDRGHMEFRSLCHEFSPRATSRQEQAMQKEVGSEWWVAIPESETTSLFLELVLKLWLLLLWPQVCLWVPLAQLWLPSPIPLISLELTEICLKSSWGAEPSHSKMRQASLVQGHTEFQIQKEDRTFKGTWVRAFSATQSFGRGRKIWYKA